MAHYLFISSRDSFESPEIQQFWDLVHGVQARSGRATLFLVQNGVLDARSGARHSDAYRQLARAGVAVIADSFSLRERAVAKLAEGVAVGTMDQLVELLVEPGTKAIWH